MPTPTSKTDIAIAAAGSSADAAAAKKQARQKFEHAFDVIRDELVAHFAAQGMAEDAVEWYRRNLNYNVPGGKLNRGLSVVDSVATFKGRGLSGEEYFKAAILGWCVELLQAFFLVSDDMMDASVTRRGQPCYFRLGEVGDIAINDSFMLEAAIYHLLKTHFRQESYYVDILELFHETTHQTEMGQLVDLITAPEDHVDLSKFSLKKHAFIVKYKTAYYSFYLPVALAMHVCHIPQTPLSWTPRDPYQVASDILLPLGEYFQIQDDFLDYSGTHEQIGKIGTDIIDNKCSWCINTALALASPEQRKILDENYGQKSPEKEQKIKDLYEELQLRERYRVYEEGAYQKITALIDSIPEEAVPQTANTGSKENPAVLRREVFKIFLDKIYKRTK